MTVAGAVIGKAAVLARDGGTPVRDIRKQPWPRWPLASERQWVEQIEPAMRAVYLSHAEGLGGTHSQAFEQEFARFCDARHCCLLPHGTDALMAALVAALEL